MHIYCISGAFILIAACANHSPKPPVISHIIVHYAIYTRIYLYFTDVINCVFHLDSTMQIMIINKFTSSAHITISRTHTDTRTAAPSSHLGTAHT